jgi:hypothetical protein
LSFDQSPDRVFFVEREYCLSISLQPINWFDVPPFHQRIQERQGRRSWILPMPSPEVIEQVCASIVTVGCEVVSTVPEKRIIKQLSGLAMELVPVNLQ